MRHQGRHRLKNKKLKMDTNTQTATTTPSEKKPSKHLSFEERIAYRIADVVVERVIEGLNAKLGAQTSLMLHQLPGCRLEGLRLSQFERFCAIMRENPGKKPYHAALQVLEEVSGRGGYKNPSSLHRYALSHRKFW